jgi:ABC-type molybdate transport system ATPase subunit
MAPLNGVNGTPPVDVSVATSPSNLGATPQLLKELSAGIAKLNAGDGDDALRQDMSTKARDIMLALETPRETSIKHIWGEVRYPGSRPRSRE